MVPWAILRPTRLELRVSGIYPKSQAHGLVRPGDSGGPSGRRVTGNRVLLVWAVFAHSSRVDRNSVAFWFPAKRLTFSGSWKPISWQKVEVLTSKQHAPKKTCSPQPYCLCKASYSCVALHAWASAFKMRSSASRTFSERVPIRPKRGIPTQTDTWGLINILNGHPM